MLWIYGYIPIPWSVCFARVHPWVPQGIPGACVCSRGYRDADARVCTRAHFWGNFRNADADVNSLSVERSFRAKITAERIQFSFLNYLLAGR